MNLDKRFIVEKEKLPGISSGAKVITDTQTGVQYLYVFEGYGAGLTALLDRDGKPLLDPRYAKGKL